MLGAGIVRGRRDTPTGVMAARAAYPGQVNPRVRRLIVSGVLGAMLLIVVAAALWNQFA